MYYNVVYKHKIEAYIIFIIIDIYVYMYLSINTLRGNEFRWD